MSIEAGNRALADGRWKEAADAFRSALAEEQSGAAHYGLGQALWWLGDMSGGMAHLEQASAAFHSVPDPAYAAASALRISFHQRAHLGNPAAAAGWLARAKRLIDENQVDFLRGELFLTSSFVTDDSREGERFARQAIELGKSSGDADLELCGISQLGSWLVEQGRTDEGLALLGEAMAACAGGETANLETVVFTSCRTMVACARCADFTRAVQWVREAERVAKEHGVPFLHAECRAVYASVLFATGEWSRVEEIANEAIAISRGEAPAYHAAALATLAELRLAQGRVEEAERLLAGFEDEIACIAPLARIQLRRGKPAPAASSVQRRLAMIGEAQLESTILLELLGEAEIALGEGETAAGRGRTIAALGPELGCRIAEARGHRLEGMALAGSDPPSSRKLLDAALTGFAALQMPYEVARTRYLLATTLRSSDPEVAGEEARVALEAFERLGAAGDADLAAALLRELGVKASRSGPKRLQILTRREREVLTLLSEGLSNPEIAGRLFVSRKTVEHHVSHILTKLGLKSRAQAAAEAIRRAGELSAGK